MIVSRQKDGSLVTLDPSTGLSSIITLAEIEDFKSEIKDDYTREWREAMHSSLLPFGLSSISTCLIINGRFDHNKHALRRHLKRVNREEHLEKIWELIK